MANDKKQCIWHLLQRHNKTISCVFTWFNQENVLQSISKVHAGNTAVSKNVWQFISSHLSTLVL